MASAMDSVQRIPDLSIRSLIKFLQAPSTEPVAMGSPLSQVLVVTHAVAIAMEVVGNIEQGLALGAEQFAFGDGLPKTFDDLADIALEDSQRHQAGVQLGVRSALGMKDVSRFPDFLQ